MNRAVLVLMLVTVGLAGCSRSAPAQGPVTHNSVKLAWTVPGDDSLTGRATSYDLRFSTTPITATNFASATRFVATPVPGLSGARDSVVVTGLSPQTTYHFAIKTADEVPNWSGVSNIPTATTLEAPDVTPPAAIRDLRIGGMLAKLPMLVGVRW